MMATKPTPAGGTPTPSPHPPQSTPPNINFRNPTPLSATQEAQVRALYYRRVRGLCAAEIKEFAACAINRTVTATWVCRKQRLAMNTCMVEHAKPEEEDRAREEWFAGREECRRAREKEEREREERRVEIIKMMRDDEEREGAKQQDEVRKKEGKGWLLGLGKG